MDKLVCIITYITALISSYLSASFPPLCCHATEKPESLKTMVIENDDTAYSVYIYICIMIVFDYVDCQLYKSL